jgi:hypothetical protein
MEVISFDRMLNDIILTFEDKNCSALYRMLNDIILTFEDKNCSALIQKYFDMFL